MAEECGAPEHSMSTHELMAECSRLRSKLEDALDKASRFDRAEVWAQQTELRNAELREALKVTESRLDSCEATMKRDYEQYQASLGRHAEANKALVDRLDSIVSVVGGACTKRHPHTVNRTNEGHFCHACGVIDGLCQQTCPLDRDVERRAPDSDPASLNCPHDKFPEDCMHCADSEDLADHDAINRSSE